MAFSLCCRPKPKIQCLSNFGCTLVFISLQISRFSLVYSFDTPRCFDDWKRHFARFCNYRDPCCFCKCVCGLWTKLTRLYLSTSWLRLFILRQIGISLHIPQLTDSKFGMWKREPWIRIWLEMVKRLSTVECSLFHIPNVMWMHTYESRPLQHLGKPLCWWEGGLYIHHVPAWAWPYYTWKYMIFHLLPFCRAVE